MSRRTLVDACALLILGGVAAWVEIGFFHPDPYLSTGSGTSRITILLWAVRILIPLLAVLIAGVFIALRRKSIRPGNIGLLAGAAAAGCLLFYPIANAFFQQQSFHETGSFHPYLQLRPNDFVLRTGDRAGRFVIVCLGGSTTEFKDRSGVGWTERLERLLENAIPGKTVEVYNQGRQWYTVQHSLLNYEVNIRPHHPDMIIVMQSINDLLHNADFSYFSHGAFREDYGHFYGPVNRIFRQQSLLDYLWNIIASSWYHTPRQVIDTDRFPGLAPYERNLRSMIDLAGLDSTQIVLMTEPFLFKDPIAPEERDALYMLNHEAVGPTGQWSLGTAIRGMNAYNDVCRKLAREKHLLLIDLERTIPKSLRYFTDEVHYQDTTYTIIPQFIADRLQTSGLLH